MNNISPANSSRPLDLTACPLTDSHLIEASAGTGKTWTITGLYLRLLLESELSPEQILVVTFTEDATQELKDRIRRRITSALRFFEQLAQNPASVDNSDPLLQSLAKQFVTPEQRKLARLRLDHAARVLDQAAISTIHGFCNRLLQDFAFESGVLFEANLEESDRALLGQLIDDYWRSHNHQWHPLFVSHLFNHSPRVTADQLQKSVGGLLSRAVHHGLDSIIHRDDLPAPEALAIDTQQLATSWANQRQNLLEMVQFATGKKFLSASKDNYKAENVESWITGLDHWLLDHAGDSSFANLTALAAFGQSRLVKARSKSADKNDWWPDNPFSVLADQLLEQLDKGLAGLRWHLLQHAMQQLPQLKTQKHLMTFDDLLLQVRDGLRRDGAGDWLAQAVKQQYPAALIDEFQDTDPVQFEIFSTIYLKQQPQALGPQDQPQALDLPQQSLEQQQQPLADDFQSESDNKSAENKNCLFLIGDPKQAIYSFRNADIFAYLQAVQSAKYRWQLGTNWRSEPALIDGVNKLFSSNNNPFLFSDIEFHPVNASNKNHWQLFVDGQAAGGVNICAVDGEDYENKADKSRRGIAAAAAARIHWLLAPGRAEFRQLEAGQLEPGQSKGKKTEKVQAVKAGDIAILVRKNQEGELMRQALSRLGVRSVIQSRQSVFQSAAARDIQWLLQAVLDAGRSRNLYALLATPLYQFTAQALDPLDEQLLEQLQERFLDYHNRWQKDGVAAMLRFCLQQEKILPRVARLADGERRLTDIRHLSELLQQTAHEQKLGPGGLVSWLRQQRLDSDNADSQQLRLESDEALVRIVTIHKSKGLEYPLVFCPFLWSSGFSSAMQPDFPSAHTADGEMKIWMDGEDENGIGKKQLAAIGQAEAMAEDLRLLYVALTRPVNACWLWWGRVHNPSTSSLATAMGCLLFADDAFYSDEQTLDKQNQAKQQKLVEEPVKKLKALGKDLSQAEIELRLQKLFEISKNQNGFSTIRLEDRPILAELPLTDDLDQQLNAPLKFSRQLHSQRMLHSFSSLHAAASHSSKQVDVESPDYDAEPVNQRQQDQQEVVADQFSFPRGANPGSCLHAIFEFSDFTDRQSVVEQIPIQLEKFAIDNIWQTVTEQWFDTILQTPLLNSVQVNSVQLNSDQLENQQDNLSLSQITNEHRLNELEFVYPTPLEKPEVLKSVFDLALDDGKASDIRFENIKENVIGGGEGCTKGFMKGFIDLVFVHNNRWYILDYKSNYLGDHVQDYTPDQLHIAMQEAGYDLQYTIYTVALNRYLKYRLGSHYDYDKHFGGVLYLYLRGMDGSGDTGVYFARTEKAVLEKVEELLQ